MKEIAWFSLAILSLAYCAGGCGSQSKGPTRDQAASVVVALSGAVRIVDHACALTAVETESYQLAEKCAGAYGAARESLLASALGLDVWDTDRARSACAILDAVKHVRELGNGGTEIRASLAAAEYLAAPLCKRN